MKEEGGGPRLPIGLGLLVISLGSGCMDVLCYQGLGEVFTSAMTGNLALLGLRLGQGDAADAIHNGAAFAGFVGGLCLGLWRLRGEADRSKLLQALAIQLVLLGAFAWLWPIRSGDQDRYGLIGLSSLAMGVQSAVAHRIGVHGVSTTYFTGTLANIVSGLIEPASTPTPAMPPWRRVTWPVMALLTYLGGAALAGHFTGSGVNELPFALANIPWLTTLTLFVIIAATGPKARAPA